MKAFEKALKAPFQGTANLQSSINAKDSLGTISLSAIYGALVVSCIFLPTLIIRKLTVKWALFFSMMCYAPYIAAQFYPRFYTLVPVCESLLRKKYFLDLKIIFHYQGWDSRGIRSCTNVGFKRLVILLSLNELNSYNFLKIQSYLPYTTGTSLCEDHRSSC